MVMQEQEQEQDGGKMRMVRGAHRECSLLNEYERVGYERETWSRNGRGNASVVGWCDEYASAVHPPR